MNIRAYFPLNRRICPGDTGALIVTIVLYLVICGVAGVLRWVVGWLPVVGWVIRMLAHWRLLPGRDRAGDRGLRPAVTRLGIGKKNGEARGKLTRLPRAFCILRRRGRWDGHAYCVLPAASIKTTSSS